MDENFTVGHPFYFPTQVIFLDDDPDFLEGISLMLNKNLSFRLLQSVSDAIECVNQAHKHIQIQQRCYSNYKTGPQESDSLSHIDIDKIHLEVLNSARFQTASTVIVDYSMPEMNGLEFLMQLKNPFIKKVLLTGQADTELAIKAFNKQLIDQFIDKHDPKLRLKINTIISNFQDQYFRNSFKLITDPIIANNRDAFLVDAEFHDFFLILREKYQCIEYYMIDTPRPGFLMIDNKGNKKCLLIFNHASMLAHIETLKQIKAPSELIKKLSRNELIPGFTIEEGDQPLAYYIDDWQTHYFPAMSVDDSVNYIAGLIPADHLSKIKDQPIITYADFLEANTISSEIIH